MRPARASHMCVPQPVYITALQLGSHMGTAVSQLCRTPCLSGGGWGPTWCSLPHDKLGCIAHLRLCRLLAAAQTVCSGLMQCSTEQQKHSLSDVAASGLNSLKCCPKSSSSVTLQKDHSSLKQQADAQAAQVSDLKAELRGSMAECEQLEVRLTEKDRQQDALQQMVQQLQQQNAAAQQELAAAHSRHGRTQAEMAALEG